MIFCSCGFIFILFLKNLACKAQKAVDYVPSFEFFEIETKLHKHGLNFERKFWDKNLQTDHSEVGGIGIISCNAFRAASA